MEFPCTLTLKELLESGAHFGHQTSRWNPKMKPFIFEEKNGLYIIDLAKTLGQLKKAVSCIQKIIEQERSILFVGTKKQAKQIIREVAIECGEFFASERWLGGMLTNMATIRNSVKTLNRIELDLEASNSGLTKKEIALLAKRHRKLLNNLEGVRHMNSLPGLLIVIDPGYERIAVAEAGKLGIPVMALVDTNCDPTPINHVIPCNDDSIKSIRLVVNVLKDAVIDAKKRSGIEILSPVRPVERPAEEAVEELPLPTGEAQDEASSKEGFLLWADIDNCGALK
ncbi:30S ribosomal protein S2 [Chlamydia trachomatis]|uniref:Small ribosomal subunit protein uS2 n=1 Tax=Chlamydia trachomatis TaxID=813 RepID=A1X3B8_CHLTH|nr:30S ribosomal protein S2 [Chlamydia trachomatis]ABA42633.1 S2 ribosomal protein [Chlamydia trachomatis]ABB72121.1 ribosomal protein S2 [Chlamydia trachomatis]AFA51543.1 S2 ribosomal protein subunit [Chlamydia trachomatis]AGT69289.1 30S ribosomal protein S2 [Chlamydia trachomatis]ATW06815.1 30S ribosomal protein S2 [Chlamydia trachomatis]